MADSITRCPKCHTSFRITEAHLKSAKGAVRCGSCLTIFNAKDHLIANETNPAAKPASKPASKPATKPLTNKPKPKKPQAKEQAPAAATQKNLQLPPDEDDLLISDDMDLHEEPPHSDGADPFDTDFNANIMYSKSLAATESNLFERGPAEDEDDDEEKSDESWALDLLNSSDDEELPRFKKESDTYGAVAEPAAPAEESPLERDDFESDFALEDEDAEKFITQNYPSLDAEQVEEELRKTGFNEPVFTAIEPSIEELDRDPDEELHQSPPSKQFIHAIEPEPVEFSYRSSFSILDSNLLWGPLTLAMALSLVILVGWLQFDKLSRVEPYRGYYAHACVVFGCELPALVSRQQIRAVNLVVRSHPSQNGALVVDAVLQNTAGFAQPFPSLDLVFTDVSEKPVAARRFSPREYLGGEMAGKTQMPSQQPIHIALEIIDPGPDAVGYRIEIAN